MNQLIWAAMREYVQAEVKLAVTLATKDGLHPSRLEPLREQVTRFETEVLRLIAKEQPGEQNAAPTEKGGSNASSDIRADVVAGAASAQTRNPAFDVAAMVRRLRYIADTDDARFGEIASTLNDAAAMIEKLGQQPKLKVYQVCAAHKNATSYTVQVSSLSLPSEIVCPICERYGPPPTGAGAGRCSAESGSPPPQPRDIMSETPRMDKARFHGSIYEGRDVLVAISLPTSQAQRIWEEGCKLERELRQAEIGEFQERERAEKTERELAQAQTELAGSRRIIDELKERCAEMEKALREIALMGLTMPLEMSMAPDEWYKRRAGGAIKIAAWALDAALKEPR